jgi:hypothetical protein
MALTKATPTRARPAGERCSAFSAPRRSSSKAPDITSRIRASPVPRKPPIRRPNQPRRRRQPPAIHPRPPRPVHRRRRLRRPQRVPSPRLRASVRTAFPRRRLRLRAAPIARSMTAECPQAAPRTPRTGALQTAPQTAFLLALPPLPESNRLSAASRDPYETARAERRRSALSPALRPAAYPAVPVQRSARPTFASASPARRARARRMQPGRAAEAAGIHSLLPR